MELKVDSIKVRSDHKLNYNSTVRSSARSGCLQQPTTGAGFWTSMLHMHKETLTAGAMHRSKQTMTTNSEMRFLDAC
jgi:hypothetical protein